MNFVVHTFNNLVILQSLNKVKNNAHRDYSKCSSHETKRCTDKALANYRSADNRRLTISQLLINTKKLILLSYLSYLLFKLRLLSEDSYSPEGLQSADKTITHPNAKLQNAPTFTGNRSHSYISSQQMTYIDSNINFTSVICSPHNAKTTIGRYRLSLCLSYRLISARSVDQSWRSDGTTPHMSGWRTWTHNATTAWSKASRICTETEYLQLPAPQRN